MRIRRDEVGRYVVSTVRLPDGVYETMVRNPQGEWDFDESGVHSSDEKEANTRHEEAMERCRRMLT